MQRWVLVSFVAAGCGSPVHDGQAFAAEFAARWCEREEECALGEFQRHYSSLDDCLDSKEDDLHLPGWDDDDCDIDPDGSSECLDYLRSTDCEGWEGKEIEDACEHAYDC
jgi:hypothetical protein